MFNLFFEKETIEDPKVVAGYVRCVVVTPEKAALDQITQLVVLPLSDGEIGIMSNREPFVGRLVSGELRLVSGKTNKYFFIESGFVQCRFNVVTVMVSNIIPAEEITWEMVDTAWQKVNSLPSNNPTEQAVKSKARERYCGLNKVFSKGK